MFKIKLLVNAVSEMRIAQTKYRMFHSVENLESMLLSQKKVDTMLNEFSDYLHTNPKQLRADIIQELQTNQTNIHINPLDHEQTK